MGEVQIIQFTQVQARTITGISCETLRHWRKKNPYLAENSGKAARFNFSDLVCIAMTAQAIETFGASISNIGLTIDPLFRKLAESRPAVLQDQAIVIKSKNATLCRFYEIAKLGLSGPLIIVPCAPLMETMRQHLLPGLFSEPQLQIPFPPQAVGG